uniref:interleukin-15-like n=1 Tax=Scatophagus argus TaxID=75038 RepID=UPI001ED7E7AD|nr:interleukin-15-like [Scatophagus argus]
MTDFMTALPVVLVQSTCPGHQRARGIQFQSTCSLCRESHKTQVWLCFFVLSFLSAYTCSASVTDTEHLQICLEKLIHTIEKSDAMLYAPSANDIKENCINVSLRCYMLELIMVIDEEEIVDNNVDCIIDFNEQLIVDPVGCPPCEAYSLKNITVFLERLNNLLEERNVQQKTSDM